MEFVIVFTVAFWLGTIVEHFVAKQPGHYDDWPY